jgi:DNA-binding MarR family transcriptional regulator
MEASNSEIAELSRTTARFAEAMRQGTTRAFDPVRVGVLQAAADAGPLRAGEIAERLDALPSSVTRHVRVLADAGLVTTAPDPVDRRAVLVEATETGRAELAEFLAEGDRVFAEVIADWPVEDVVTLTRLLNRLMQSWAAQGTAQQQRATARRPARFVWSRV